jgi:transposase
VGIAGTDCRRGSGSKLSGDINHFASPRQLKTCFGFSPPEHFSGDKGQHGSIILVGNIVVRRLLVDAAWDNRLTFVRPMAYIADLHLSP